MHAPDFWYPAAPGPLPLKAWPLLPLSGLYDWGGRLKQWTAKPYRPRIPVLCVGNLTVGGTGKTPVTIALLRMLKAAGHRPFVLTRGYGGREKGPLLLRPEDHRSEDVGDEPLLLGRTAPTIVSADRPAGAELAQAEGADVIVMDDGFQNPSIAKTMALVVVDGRTLFGNGRIVPAGPLRESVARGLSRADGIIIMGETDPAAVARVFPDHALPVFRGHLEPDAPTLDALRQRRLLAFAGIGRPEKFFATLRSGGLRVEGTRTFPDHHRFTAQDLNTLKSEAAALEAELVTTEKDAVRVPQAVHTLPVHAEFDDTDGLERMLASLMARRLPDKD